MAKAWGGGPLRESIGNFLAAQGVNLGCLYGAYVLILISKGLINDILKFTFPICFTGAKLGP